MKRRNSGTVDTATGMRHLVLVIVIILNISLLSGAFLLYGSYIATYKDKLWQESLSNISKLNRSASMNIDSMIKSWSIKLDDINRYAEMHTPTYYEMLEIISDSNSDKTRYFELIGSDYTGYLAEKKDDGSFLPLSYKSSSYAKLQQVFDDIDDNNFSDICLAPEFTDSGETALKFFAIYKHIELLNAENKPELYTLLLATPSTNIISSFYTQIDYDGQSTVLMDSSGNYIVSNSNFKSANFYDYLYEYNNLTLDEKNDIRDTVKKNGSGELFYKNSGAVVEDCVFRYEKMDTNGWYCVTCVPVSSCRGTVINNNFVVFSVSILALLLIVDVSWLLLTNYRLRVSMKSEKIANAAKGNFMSRMSHEIRTPLNAVIGYNTIAKNELSDSSSDAEYRQAGIKVMDCLNKSSIASKHLLTIINDVLDMSAIDSGKIKMERERFDLMSLITSVTTVFYSQAQSKGVELDVVFNTITEEWFIGDQMRINQILTNLLSNAIKFTASGGTVRLAISQPDAENNAAHIHFDVSDTGIGMTEEYLSHIWAPFEQEDFSISRRFGGTGLGLSITKNLVDLMGGSITVESEKGVGTTFHVEITFERTEQPEIAEVYDFADINALVVDDDEYTCNYIKQLFLRCGTQCTSTTSCNDAIKMFADAAESDHPFTLCMVDWKMPEMDGIEVAEKFKNIGGKDFPIIVITAYHFTEIADRAADAGITNFIAKPLFQSSLFDLLASITDKKQKKRVEKSEIFDFHGARVLLAEDNMMNMEIAKKILESAGFAVDNVWNGAEAVFKFSTEPPETYAAILMDVHMPVMDGHKATQAIRASAHSQAKTIPIIAMTADAFSENVSEAHAAGMDDHISKPIDVKLLFTTLKKYIK